MQAECPYELKEGQSCVCPQCGHRRTLPAGVGPGALHRRCPKSTEPVPVVPKPPPARPTPAPSDDCVHRGEVLREIGCGGCKGQILLPIYACALHGECTLRDYKSKSPDFAGATVCSDCRHKKPFEPPLPNVVERKLKQAFHLARDTVGDLRAGRPRRSPQQIAELFDRHCRRCPLYNSIEQVCSVCLCNVSADQPELNRLAWATLGCGDELAPRWLPTSFERHSLTVFVPGHEPHRLATVAERPYLRKILLQELVPSLPLHVPPMQLAENQVYTSDLLLSSPSEYLGIAASSWNDKYNGRGWKGIRTPHCLPLERLDELPLERDVVWAGHANDDPRLIVGIDGLVRGTVNLTDEALAAVGKTRPDRGGLLASNFICHREVALDLRRFQRACIACLDARYGATWPLDVTIDDPAVSCRLPAYVGEALSITYFALRTDLKIKQIPAP